MENIGDRICNIRKEQRMTQTELCGDYINRVVLSKIENNKMSPSIDQLKFISIKLNKSLNYFLIESEHSNFKNKNIGENFLKTLFDDKQYSEISKYKENYSNEFDDLMDYNKYYFLGISYYNIDLSNCSLKYLRKYVSSYTNTSDVDRCDNILRFSISLNTLSKIMIKNKSFEKAEKYLQIARKQLAFYNIYNEPIVFWVYNNIAYIYIQQCKFREVVDLLEDFLVNCKSFIDLTVVANMYLSLNIAYNNIGNYDKSIYCIQKAIYLFLYKDNFNDAGMSYLNYINALRYAGRIEEAFNILNQSNEHLYNKEVNCRFVIQEMIMLYNLSDYNSIIGLVNKVDLSALPKTSKSCYFYILSCLAYIDSDLNKCEYYLLKYEKHFISKSYYFDLICIYKRLLDLSKDEIYAVKISNIENLVSRKNINL